MEIVSNPTDIIPEEILNIKPKPLGGNETYLISSRYTFNIFCYYYYYYF